MKKDKKYILELNENEIILILKLLMREMEERKQKEMTDTCQKERK